MNDFIPEDYFASYTSGQYAEHLSRLSSDTAHDCAFVKATLARFAAQTPDDIISVLNFGGVRVGVTMAGRPVLIDNSNAGEIVGAWWARGEFAGMLPVNFKVGGLNVRAGVLAIAGSGGVGKTPLAHAIANASLGGGERYGLVRFGEPFAGYETDFSRAAVSLVLAMYYNRVVVLDSMKDLLSMEKGAAMKAGLSRGAFVTLSSWSIVAAELGCTLIVPINPSTPDVETVATLVEALNSNVSSVLKPDGDGWWSYSTRTREAGLRESGRVRVDWGRGSLPSLTRGESTGVADSVAVSAAELVESLSHASILRSIK